MKSLLRKRNVYGGIATLLTAALVVTGVHFSQTDAVAKETFTGILDIVDANSADNPFQIFEIVPDTVSYNLVVDGEEINVPMSMGELGYYIDGAEPIGLSANLANLSTQAQRKAYLEAILKAEGDNITGPLSAIASSTENSAPLYYSAYEEAYSLSENELQQAADEGKPWTLLNVSEDHEEYLTDIEMKKSLSGNFLKKFSPSENIIPSISENFAAFIDGDSSVSVNDIMEMSSSGDFDPAFTISASGNYIVEFEVNNAKRGYRADLDSLTEATQTTVMPDDTAIYQLYTNDEGQNYFVYAGKYADIKASLPVGSSEAAEAYIEGEESSSSEEIWDDEDTEDEEEVDAEGSEGEESSTEPSLEEGEGDSSVEEPVSSEGPEEEGDEPEEKDDSDEGEGGESARAIVYSRPVASRPVVMMGVRLAEADESAPEKDEDKEEKEDSAEKSEDSAAAEGQTETADTEEAVVIEDTDEETTEEVLGVEVEEEYTGEFSDEELPEEVLGEDEILGEEEQTDITETGAASGVYYSVEFVYDSSLGDEPCYSIKDWNKVTTGSSNAYVLDASLLSDEDAESFLYPNYAHTGSIKGTDLEQYVFEYLEPTDDGETKGNYDLINAEGNTEVYRVIGIKTYYRGGLTNNNWFTKYVFDRVETVSGNDVATDYLYYDYQCFTPSAFSAAVEPGAAGLVYLSNASGRFLPEGAVYGSGSTTPAKFSKDNDISEGMLQKLLSAVVTDSLPIIVDYSIVTDKSLEGTYIQKLAQILCLEDPSIVDSYIKGGSLSGSDILNIDLSAYETFTPNHHVHDSIYIYDYSGYEDRFCNTAFTTNFGSEGFEEITNLIDDENQYRRSEGLTSFIPDDINQAVAIKYILCYKGRRGIDTKSEIRVLELQPGPSVPDELGDMKEGNLYIDPDDQYTLYRVKNNQGDIEALIKDAPYPVVLDSMSTREFVGHEEDINSTYDLVYIGLSTYYMNTETVSGNERTVYNDTDMDGLIYTNVGDLVRTNNYINGWLSRDYDGDKLKSVGWSTVDGDYALQRFSGNDITSRKVDELKEYAKAAYPVLLDYHCIEGPITSTQIDEDYIDNQSYLYEFLDWATSEYGVNNTRNIFRINSSGNLSGNEKMFEWYLNLAKPEIEIQASTPHLEYAEYCVKDGDNYYMDYQFEILDKRSSDPDNKYTAKLYIDDNADGKYPESEESSELMGRKMVVTDSSGNTVAYNKLKAGKTYRIRQYVSEKYSIGPLPWKLEICLNSQKERRDSVIGCYKIHRTGAKDISVNAIQILPNTSGKQWNLEKAIAGEGTNNNGITSLKNLIANLPDYNISVKTMTSNEFVRALKEGSESTPAYDYLNKNEINLLILGFGFNYEILDDDLSNLDSDLTTADVTRAVNRVKTFVASGHSTVVGADVVSRTGYKPGINVNASGQSGHLASWGYNMTQWLRPMIGMDRYNITGKSKMEGYDKALEPNDGAEVDEIQGYGNTMLNEYQASRVSVNDKDHYDKYYSYSGDAGKASAGDSTGSGKVNKINDGQLTLFPYALEDTYGTNDNDWPYYSLDLQGDEDGDDESDVTVWYSFCKMGNSDYVELNKRDARDLYYLYTKGNITYVGTCMDAGGDTTEYELIVNVLIAAYEGGVQDPNVTIIDNEDIESAEIDTIYLPYYNETVEGGGTNTQLMKGDEQHVFYYPSNLSTRSDNVASYYYEPADGSGDTTLQLSTGETVKVKKLPITSVQRVGDDGERLAVAEKTIEDVKDVNGNKYTITGYEQLSNSVYDITVPISSIMASDEQSVDIYVHVDSVRHSNYEDADSDLTYGNDKVTLMKTEMFNLD